MPTSPIFPLGHFYSPIVDVSEVLERGERFWQPAGDLPGIDLNDASQIRVLTEVLPKWMPDFDYPVDEADAPAGGFFLANDQFTWLDARTLFAFLCEWKPSKIIEVGSGYSTSIMLDARRRFLADTTAITCIEPYPRPVLRKALEHGGAELLERKVQSLEASFFDQLEAGDVLFIDSSHVSKTGSDCNFLYLDVLPRLKAGVRIHIHDIFLPFEYPKRWVVDENRSWNEQYLLRALLTHSNAFEVIFGSAYASAFHHELAASAVATNPSFGVGGGSFWIERSRH